MISATTAWLASVIVIGIIWALQFWRRGPWIALGIAVVLTFFVPAWVEMDFFGLPFHPRTAIAGLGLFGFVLHSSGRIWSPLILSDVAVAAMVALHVFSDSMNSGLSATIPFRAYGEWALPYVAGRFCVRNSDELLGIVPWVLAVLMMLGIGGAIESFTGENLWEWVFGTRPDRYREVPGLRFGLHRAAGPAEHPIFFAMIPMLLFPWAIFSIRAARSRAEKALAVLAAVLSIIGVLSAVSRGPAAGLIIAAGFVLAVRYRWVKWTCAAATAAMIGICIAQPDAVMKTLETGIEHPSRLDFVHLDDEEFEFTGTQARILLFRAYAPALKNASLFGFGTEATTGFPPNIPGLPQSKLAVHLLKYVDNAYILLGLRFGWLGILFFLALNASTVWVSLSLAGRGRSGLLAIWVGAVVLATLAVCMTVWFAYDFGFECLWSCGIIAGLASHTVDANRSVVDS